MTWERVPWLFYSVVGFEPLPFQTLPATHGHTRRRTRRLVDCRRLRRAGRAAADGMEVRPSPFLLLLEAMATERSWAAARPTHARTAHTGPCVMSDFGRVLSPRGSVSQPRPRMTGAPPTSVAACRCCSPSLDPRAIRTSFSSSSSSVVHQAKL